MRVAIIGLGRAGAVHFDVCRSLPDVEVVAVCDPSPAARHTACSAGVRAYADLAPLLAREALDAAIICTPPADHAALATACLEAGLHVLCEKPLALTIWDGLEMLLTAIRARRQVLLACKFRHVPEVVRAREMVQAGDLGEPVAFEVSFCSPVSMSGRWNAQPERAGGGIIIDNGCHAFDIASYLFGSISRVQAIPVKSLQTLPVEDSASLIVWAGNGVIGKVDLSWSLSTGRESYLVVHGSRGTVEIGWRRSRVWLAGQGWRQIGGPYDKVEAHRRMHRGFIDSVSNHGRPWISAAERLQAVAAVEAAYRSLKSGAAERVAIHGMREPSFVSQPTTAQAAMGASL